MKIIKETGAYLKEKAKTKRNISYILFIIGAIGLIFYGILSVIILFIGGYFLRGSTYYNKGLEGERIVTEQLKKLDDDYYLINDIKLPDSYGNIDHVLLGPNGISIIETKNLEGEIRCYGDKWYQYKQEWSEGYEIKSPSKQVKYQAFRLKQLLESIKAFKKQIWIDGVVVFTNEYVDLNLKHQTVPVLRKEELVDYIINKQSNLIFSSKELDLIGKAILQQTKLV